MTFCGISRRVWPLLRHSTRNSVVSKDVSSISFPKGRKSLVCKRKVLLCTGAVAVFSLYGCGEKKTEAKAGAAGAGGAPVVVATATQQTIPIQLKAIGNVEAIATVAIRAEVGGQLERVYFKEGQDVRKGDPLFQIDPRVY